MLKVLIPSGLVATAALAFLATPAPLTAATADEAAAAYGGACVSQGGSAYVCSSWPCTLWGSGWTYYNPPSGPGSYGTQTVYKPCACNPTGGADVLEVAGSCTTATTTTAVVGGP